MSQQQQEQRSIQPSASLVSADGPTKRENPLTASVSAETQEDIRNASLDEVERLEAALREAIRELENQELIDRLEQDITLVRKEGLDRLDDKESAPLADSKGLQDRQNKTKKFFDEKLKQIEGLEETQRNSLMDQLQKLHKARIALLQKTLNTEAQEQSDQAYRAFLTYMGQTGTVTAYAPGADPHSNFLNDIRGKEPSAFTSDKGTVQLRGDTLVSNNPVALGMGMAAAGHKEATFGGNPWEAIEAAKTALAHGVRTVHFDKQTLKMIHNPRNGIYKSYQEYQLAMRELEAINNRNEANSGARANKINPAFNRSDAVENYVDNQAKIFNQMAPFEPGRGQMIREMSTADRAALAVHFDKDKPPAQQDGQNQIRALIRSNPVQGAIDLAEFESAYAAGLVRATHNKIETDDPLAVANYISQHANLYVRHAFYQEIDQLAPFESAADNQAFRNEVKAACLCQILDRHHLASIDPTTGKPKVLGNSVSNCNNEIKALLEHDSPQKRDEIRQIYNDHFSRTANKRNNYNNGCDEAEDEFSETDDRLFRVDKNPDYLNSEEMANSNEKLITSQTTLTNYLNLMSGARKTIDAMNQADLQLEREMGPVAPPPRFEGRDEQEMDPLRSDDSREEEDDEDSLTIRNQ